MTETLSALFEHQVQNLLAKGYPALAQISQREFLDLILPLASELPTDIPNDSLNEGRLPFVIVVTHKLISQEHMLSVTERLGKSTLINLFPVTLSDFQPIPEVILPKSTIYLLIDIDRGYDTRNKAPSSALRLINQRQRSPLTIDEGIALLTHYPEFLQKNNCFSLLASRCGDKRVPALWLSQGHPKLGWCWEGNPHTWLGSASAKIRRGMNK